MPLLMKIRKITNPEIIEKTEIGEDTVRKSQSDRLIGSCRLESLYKIATVMNVAIDDLFCIIKIEESDV